MSFIRNLRALAQEQAEIDPIKRLDSLVAYFTPEGIDSSVTVEGNAIADWDDIINSNTFTAVNSPTLNIDPNGTRQVRFNGTTQYMDGSLNITGGFDPFDGLGGSLIIKLGETVAGTSGEYLISDGASLASTETISLAQNTDIEYSIKGTNAAITAVDFGSNKVIIVNCNSSTTDIHIDGTEVVSDISNGANTGNSDIWRLANSSTLTHHFDGDVEFFAYVDKELTPQQITDIFAYHQEN